MFQLDIDRFEPKQKYPKNGSDFYLCLIRKRLIKVTPEERVRQALINFLVKEMQFPAEQVEVEVPLSRFIENEKGRADIIVFDPNEMPLILIECKKQGELFGESVKNQLIRYDNVIGAQHFMIVIGEDVRLFHHDETTKQTGTHIAMQPYDFFLKGGAFDYEVEDNDDTFVLPINEPFDKELVQELIEYGMLGEGTDRKLYPIVFNLNNFFFDKERLATSGISDLGNRITKFGNASGGEFPGNYRVYLYERDNDSIIVSFLVTSITNNAIENYKSATCLAVAIDFEKTSHLSLELRLDKYVELKSQKAIIWHDGTLTVGKLGMAKRKDVMDFIAKKAPHLILNGRVFLGEFDLKERITANGNPAIEFISRVIEYALIRDDYRNKAKVASGKYNLRTSKR